MSSAIWWLVLGLLVGWLIEWVIDWVYWRRRQTSEVWVQGDDELARMRGSLAKAHADNVRLQSELSATTALAQQRQATIDEMEGRLASMRADDKQLQVAMEAPEAQRPPAVLSTDDGTKSANLATIQLSRDEVTSLMPPADLPATDRADANDEQPLRERMVSEPTARQRDPLIDINGIGQVYEQKLFDAAVYTFEDLAALTPEQVREIIAPQRWQEIDTASWITEARRLAQKKA